METQNFRGFLRGQPTKGGGLYLTFGKKVVETDRHGEATAVTRFAAFGSDIAEQALKSLFSAADIAAAIKAGEIPASMAKDEEDDSNVILSPVTFGEGEDSFTCLGTPSQVNVEFTLRGEPEEWEDEDGCVYTTQFVSILKVESSPDHAGVLASRAMKHEARKVTRK